MSYKVEWDDMEGYPQHAVFDTFEEAIQCLKETIKYKEEMGKLSSIREQRTKLQEKIAQLKAREKELAQKDRLKERKARTKRLIELGALVESVFCEDAIEGLKAIPDEQIKRINSWLEEKMLSYRDKG